MNGSGTMVIRARVNGKTMEKSIHVNATPCAPLVGPNAEVTEILNSAAILHGFTKALNDGNANSSDFSQRRERGGFAYKDTLTGALYLRDWPNVNTPCRYIGFWPPPAGPPNTVPVGHFHTHPFVPWDSASIQQMPDEIPTNVCLDWSRRLPNDTVHALAGPSRSRGGDLDNAPTRIINNQQLPSFLVDKRFLYVYYGRNDPRNTRFPRTVGTCNRY